jgi:hypothetical protein
MHLMMSAATRELQSTTHSPEEQVLLWSIRVSPDPRIADLIRSGLNWPSLLQQATDAKLVHFLQRSLRGLPAGLVPDQVEAQLRTLSNANVLRSLRLTQRLRQLLDALSERGIVAIPFKGPVLAVQAYGDVAFRNFVDLDLLIRSADFGRARDALIHAGYRQPRPFPPGQERLWLRIEKNAVFWSPQYEHIEVHWNLMQSYMRSPLKVRELWSQLQTIDLMGRSTPTFSTENTLLMLCIHGTKHRWPDLRSIADLAHYITRNSGLDWPALYARSEQLGARRILDLGLLLARDVGGAALSPEATQAVAADRPAQKLARAVHSRLRVDTEKPDDLTCDRFFIRARERFFERFATCASLALTPNYRDWRAVVLPPALHPVYYLIRPSLVVYRQARRLLSFRRPPKQHAAGEPHR